MRKRNKESEDKKWWIIQEWKNKNKLVSKQPVLSSGIVLRDTIYGVEQTDNKYGYPSGWEAQMKDMKAGPIEIWKVNRPYVQTIENRRKSWPMYTIENGKFKNYQWPKKAMLRVNRSINRKII